MFCGECGAQAGPSQKFCKKCGAAIEPATDSTTDAASTGATDPTTPEATAVSPAPASPAAAGDGGVSGGRPKWLVPVLAGTVALIVVLAAVFALGGGDNKKRSVAAPAATTSTTSEEEARLAAEAAELRRVVAEMDTILQYSASGREGVKDVVAEVANCQREPYDGANILETAVITNRDQVLTRFSSIQTDNAQAQELLRLAKDAIQKSRESNSYYKLWMDDVSAYYYYDDCYYGNRVTTTENFSRASELSNQATAAKEAFVAAYNPVSAQLGFRQWGAIEI